MNRFSYAALLRDIGIAVFDMDGTLYRQAPVRCRMALMMVRKLAWSREGRKKIRMIAMFRKVREQLAAQEATDVQKLQYALVASRFGVTDQEVRALTDEWVERLPLPFLARCREPHVDQLFGRMKEAGIKVAVLSDYPAKNKLDALGLCADFVASANDGDINRFKPHPKGLHRILELANEPAHRCLVIGDRKDREGETARRAGARFLLKVKARPRSAFEIQHYSDLLRALPVKPMGMGEMSFLATRS